MFIKAPKLDLQIIINNYFKIYNLFKFYTRINTNRQEVRQQRFEWRSKFFSSLARYPESVELDIQNLNLISGYPTDLLPSFLSLFNFPYSSLSLFSPNYSSIFIFLFSMSQYIINFRSFLIFPPHSQL